METTDRGLGAEAPLTIFPPFRTSLVPGDCWKTYRRIRWLAWPCLLATWAPGLALTQWEEAHGLSYPLTLALMLWALLLFSQFFFLALRRVVSEAGTAWRAIFKLVSLFVVWVTLQSALLTNPEPALVTMNMALFMLCVWLFQFCPAVCCVEGVGLRAGLRKAFQLLRGYHGEVFIIYLIAYFTCGGLAWGLALLGMALNLHLPFAAVLVLVGALYVEIGCLFLTLYLKIYQELNRRSQLQSDE